MIQQGIRQQLAAHFGLQRHNANTHVQTVIDALHYSVSTGQVDELAACVKDWLAAQGEQTVELTEELMPTVQIVPIGRGD